MKKRLSAATVVAASATVLAGLAVSPAQAAGQAGQLDPSFGTGGIVKTAFTGTDMSTGGKSIVQADGKTLATGEKWFGPQFSPALVRYNADGTLDESFGFGGMTSISLGKKSASIAGTVQTPDGGYLVVATNMRGTPETPKNQVITARVTKDGKLDQSYGNHGIAVAKPQLPEGSDVMAADAVYVEQGKLAVAVSVMRGDTGWTQSGVMKLTRTGAVDKAYGASGLALLPNGVTFGVRAMAVDSHGRIGLAGGLRRTQDPEDDTSAAAVARLTKAGDVDTSFGTDGIAENADGFSNFAMDLAIDAKDRLLTAGYVQSNQDGRAAFEVTRRLSDGSPDRGFAKDGVGTYQLTDGEDVASSVHLDTAGRILVGGTQWAQTPDFRALTQRSLTVTPAHLKAPNQLERHGFEALRIAQDGKPDASFGTDGHVVTQPDFGAAVFSIATTTAGAVQLSGFSFSADLTYRFTTIRYLG